MQKIRKIGKTQCITNAYRRPLWVWFSEKIHSFGNWPRYALRMVFSTWTWDIRCLYFVSQRHFVFIAGKPKQFLSDRGPGFTPEKRKNNSDAHQLFTSFEHPQCNGMNERTNQTIVTRLKCKFNDQPRRPWQKFLEVIDEYNRTLREVTRYPPAYLMYLIVSYLFLLCQPFPPLEETRKEAVNNSLAQHAKNNVIYDNTVFSLRVSHRRLCPLRSALAHKQGKLAPVVEVAYTVLGKVSPVNYATNRAILPLGRSIDLVHVCIPRKYLPPTHLPLHMEGGICDERKVEKDEEEEEALAYGVFQK